MSEPRKTIGSMHFGPFELSTESSELRKHGQRLKLSGQAIDVLLMLASNAGRLVTREELQRKLWPGDSFGDFEHGLNAAVNRLRETLGDSATDPTYIETVPRRGYRFIARVDQVPNTTDPTVPDNAVELRYQHAADIRADLKRLKRDTDSTSTHTASAVASASSAAAVSSTQVRPSGGAVLLAEARRHKGVLALMLVVLAALIAGLGIYLSRLNERRNEWNLQGMKITRVTQSGNAANVAISPDGRYVVYVLREGEKQSLNVRQVATGSDVQILPPDEVCDLESDLLRRTPTTLTSSAPRSPTSRTPFSIGCPCSAEHHTSRCRGESTSDPVTLQMVPSSLFCGSNSRPWKELMF